MKLFNWFQKRTPPGSDRRDPTLRRRSYDGAKMGRLTSDWFATTTSSDAELNSDLPTLRNRSRSLCRDNVYARRARNIFQSNVVGTGIRMQSIRLDDLGNRREEENREPDQEHDRQGAHADINASRRLAQKGYQRRSDHGCAFAADIIDPEELA